MIDTRIGDAEREEAAARLGDNFAHGRLDHEEFNERLDAIWSARTRADLDQLFWDLPRPARTLSAAQPAPLARRGIPPLLPILVIAVLAGTALVQNAPWVLLIAALWFVVLRPRRCRRDQRSDARARVRRAARSLAP